MIKVLHPHGEVSKQDMAELLAFAIEGRRRVKEQLKKMGSFDYYQTAFSYIDNETGEEHFVGVPEQGGRDLIASDPLPPGSIYTASVDSTGTVGLYRLEVTLSGGTGKLKLAGGVSGALKESINRAFSYLAANKTNLGVARDVDLSDFHVECIDLLGNKVDGELGVAFLVACFSILRRASPQAGLLVMGDLSIQGNIKPVRSLVEPLQVAMDNGAMKAMIPIENKRHFLEVSADIVEQVDPVFYGDVKTALLKAVGT
jgi:ATP-dependent Lon protease